MQVSTHSVACFGKLPSAGDFIRYNASGPAMRALDTWVQRGLLHAAGRLGRAMEARYDAALPCGFVLHLDGAPSTLAGLLLPSRDRTGRKYPFMVVREVSGRAMPSDIAPFASEALRLAASLSQSVDTASIGTRLEAAGRLTDSAPPGSRMPGWRASDLWTTLWGDPQDGRKYVLFDHLLELRSIASRPAAGPPQFALRLPLPSTDPAVAAGFWLALVERMLGNSLERASFIWTMQGDPGWMLLTFSVPSAGLFAQMVDPDLDESSVLVLDRSGHKSAAQAALALPGHIGMLLEDESITLSELIGRLPSR
jgi:type VI secretion system ImpM family protein